MRTMLTCLAVAGALSTAPLPAQAPTPGPSRAPNATELKVGDLAPAFSLKGSDGQTHALADVAGKRTVVLAWFPKAFTGG